MPQSAEQPTRQQGMHTSRPMRENDLVGVGVGPTNLSLASLIETARVSGLAHFQSKFLEKNRTIRWHSGQFFPGALMQTEFYRDLVTPIDPTSSFTFLNYLKAHQRLDQFFCSEYICPTRREFEPIISTGWPDGSPT